MRVFLLSDFSSPEDWSRALTRLMPDVEVCIGPTVDNSASIDIALIWKPPPQGFQEMSNLKAILTLGAGVDQLDLTKLPPQVPIARLVDTSLTSTMCEYCLLAVLRYTRQFDKYERQAKARVWQRHPTLRRAQQHVAVLGLGVLGEAVARHLTAAGLPVSGWSRIAKDISGVNCYYGPDGLNNMLPQVAILICLLPLTAMTSGILNAGLFAALPRGAFLINVGRGGHLVEDDLLTALQKGHLAGATLDVFQQEPLPVDHPFWYVPSITITPHVASTIDPNSAAPLIVENIRRACAGQPLRYAVDVMRGY